MSTEDAESDWKAFVSDASRVFAVEDEILQMLPAIAEQPFNPEVQRRAKELFDSPRLCRATEAAQMLSYTPLGREDVN